LQPLELGKRLRELRGSKTQLEFAEELGISRTYLGVLETGAQQPSRNVLKALHEKLGVSSDWVLYGDGPVAAPARLPDWEKDRAIAEMLGEPAPRPRPVPKDAPTMMLHDSGRTDKKRRMEERTRESDAIWSVKRTRETLAGSNFGYKELPNQDKVRLRALTEDPEIEGTQLQLIVKDSELWNRAGGISGTEFEALRFYFSRVGDRPHHILMNILHFIRVCMTGTGGK
jgi:transcriptional regulator with XRE-family HTH domain